MKKLLIGLAISIFLISAAQARKPALENPLDPAAAVEQKAEDAAGKVTEKIGKHTSKATDLLAPANDSAATTGETKTETVKSSKKMKHGKAGKTEDTSETDTVKTGDEATSTTTETTTKKTTKKAKGDTPAAAGDETVTEKQAAHRAKFGECAKQGKGKKREEFQAHMKECMSN